MRRACGFLLEKQRLDGGWGESYRSCQDKVYSQLDGMSHVVNTAWALLSLIDAGYEEIDAKPLHAAARFLLFAQLPTGAALCSVCGGLVRAPSSPSACDKSTVLLRCRALAACQCWLEGHLCQIAARRRALSAVHAAANRRGSAACLSWAAAATGAC